MKTPSDSELDLILKAADDAVLSIRGHVALESALAELIAHAIPAAHEVELERISFPLKVDLVIGLGAIQPESRQLYMKLNKIRNRFAHSAVASLQSTDLAEIKNSMSRIHRTIVGDAFDGILDSRSALEYATAVTFYEAKAASKHIFTRKIEWEETMKEVHSALKISKPLSSGSSEPLSPVHKRVADRVRARLEESAPTPTNQNKPLSSG